MARKSDWTLIGGVALVAVVALLFLSQGQRPASLVGFSTISVSQVSVNDQQEILFTGSVDGGGERGQIELTNDTFGELGFLDSTVDLKIEVDNQSCKYNVDFYDEIVYNSGFTGSCWGDAACTGQCPNGMATGTCSGGGCCYRKAETPAYQKAIVNPVPNVEWNVKVTLTRNGVEEVHFLNPQQTEVSTSYGNIKWIGSLLGNAFCGSPNNVVLLRPLGQQVWRATLLSPKYNAYSAAYAQWLAAPGVGGQAQYTQASSASGNLNTKVTEMVASLTGTYSNYYFTQPQQNIVNPVVQFRIRAADIGLRIPTGARPEILSISYLPVVETNVTNVNVWMKNVGREDDSFDASLTCDKPITFNRNRVSLSVNQEGTLPLSVEGFAGEYSCTVEVNAVNAPLNADSQDFVMSISKRRCPAEFSCCKNSDAYLDKSCPDTYEMKSRGGYNNTPVEYYIQVTRYDCATFSCTPTSYEEVPGSATVGAVPTLPPQPTAEVEEVPSATVVVAGTPQPGLGGITGGIVAGESGGAIVAVLVVAALGVGYFVLRKRR